jgi:hypothetical protein
MMKSLFILMFTAICSPVFAQQTLISDKNAEIRSVTTFSGIRVSGGIEVYLSQGDSYSLAVSAAEDKFRDKITTEVKNGILIISYNNDHFRLSSGNKELRVYISFSALESLEASGASHFIITDKLNVNSMLIKLSGASFIQGPVKINDLTLNLSGASLAKISGTAQNLNLTASGASDVKDYDLAVQNCVADLSGASDVRIIINNSISGSASGASTLHYEGNPDKKDVATSGASSISPRK